MTKLTFIKIGTTSGIKTKIAGLPSKAFKKIPEELFIKLKPIITKIEKTQTFSYKFSLIT